MLVATIAQLTWLPPAPLEQPSEHVSTNIAPLETPEPELEPPPEHPASTRAVATPPERSVETKVLMDISRSGAGGSPAASDAPRRRRRAASAGHVRRGQGRAL